MSGLANAIRAVRRAIQFGGAPPERGPGLSTTLNNDQIFNDPEYQRRAMNQKHLFHRIALFTLLFGLALTACGGGGGPTATPSHTAPPPTPTTPPTPSASDRIEQGRTYFDAGDMDQAVAEFQAAVALEPDNASAHMHLGAAYGEQARYDQAGAELLKALELKPDYAKAHTNLCMVYWSQNMLDQALAECQAALKLDDDDPDTYNHFGVIYLMQEKPAEAIAQFQQAIQLDPDHDWAHNNLGRAYSNQGQFDQAIAELKEALRINPDHATAHYNLGLTYARQELYEQAIPEYETAVKLDASLTSAHMDMAIIYREMGQTEEAIAQFETYLELEPDDPQRAALETEIARLKKSLASIELLPFTNAQMGISGVVPAGWTEKDPGNYVSPDGQAIAQLAAPGATAEQFAQAFLSALNVTQAVQSVGSVQPAELKWDLYMIEGVQVYGKTGSLALALAQDGAGAYIVAVFAQPDEIEALIETVGNPALVAFTVQK
jgi:tetratricopeptide (TPR) repeat protein